ncbi:DNA-directed primase/polymerase protein-like isoform X2 [Dysidea avara]|uniref:DNA-directed primase/polymerase protein-like isoform X2 n=1 Tax=Dysidea avara TaxID=196820 RepID=UPI0033305091
MHPTPLRLSLTRHKPKDGWKTFPRQKMALDARKHEEGETVFAEEISQKGARRYVVANYETFVRHYLEMKQPVHYYEVILEGVPIKLYFDLEYKMSANPSLNPACGAELVNVFVKYVLYELEVCCGWSCSEDHVMDLDSTTKKKFSRHLIFVSPEACFTSSQHVGNFVHHVCHKLHQLHNSSETKQCYYQLFSQQVLKNHCPHAEDLLRLFVLDDKGRACLICDEAVYTKNRNFRLPFSSKFGKDAQLLPTEGTKYKGLQDDRSIIYDSLICNVRTEDQPTQLKFEEPKPKNSQYCKSTIHNTTMRPLDTTTEEGYSHSPYPEIDRFITKQLTRGGVQGAIRRWGRYSQGRWLVYDIKDYQYCENIGRHHKSNNIKVVVDLSRGVYYQKCHDPDCHYFRSKDIDPEILDASVEASEIFDEFLKAGEEELSTQHLIASDDTTKHSNGLSTVTAYTSSSSSCCSSSSNM